MGLRQASQHHLTGRSIDHAAAGAFGAVEHPLGIMATDREIGRIEAGAVQVDIRVECAKPCRGTVCHIDTKDRLSAGGADNQSIAAAVDGVDVLELGAGDGPDWDQPVVEDQNARVIALDRCVDPVTDTRESGQASVT
jgi:hypothetical protein